MDADEGVANMVQASKAVGAGIISATSPLVIHSDTIARWDGKVFGPIGKAIEFGYGAVTVTPDGDMIIRGEFVGGAIDSDDKPQLSPAALGVRCEE